MAAPIAEQALNMYARAADLWRGCEPIDHTSAAAFVRAGVRPLALLSPPGSVRIMHGRFDRFGGIMVDPDGAAALVVPALDPDGEMIDLVAWRPTMPHRPASVCNIAFALGEAAIESAIATRRPLNLFRTVPAWLAAESDGAVIIDWLTALPLLRRCRALVADDLRLGRELRSRLTASIRVPLIRVAI